MSLCKTLSVSRSNVIAKIDALPAKRRGRPPLPDPDLVEQIKSTIGDLPTYGYRRVHAILRRRALALGATWPNAKRVYRVMRHKGLLLQRHTGNSDGRRHDGRAAVDPSNLR